MHSHYVSRATQFSKSRTALQVSLPTVRVTEALARHLPVNLLVTIESDMLEHPVGFFHEVSAQVLSESITV